VSQRDDTPNSDTRHTPTAENFSDRSGPGTCKSTWNLELDSEDTLSDKAMACKSPHASPSSLAFQSSHDLVGFDVSIGRLPAQQVDRVCPRARITLFLRVFGGSGMA
jgi:hypothetical protein